MVKTTNKTVSKPRCGLCGKTGKVTKTLCCDHWICDDSDTYVLFSYARNSCWRNHDRYTLCAYHSHEGHTGAWQTCKTCRESFDTRTMWRWQPMRTISRSSKTHRAISRRSVRNAGR